MAANKAHLHEELRYYFDLEAPGEPLWLSLSEIWDTDERRAAYAETCAQLRLPPGTDDPHYVVIPVPQSERARVLTILAASKAVDTTVRSTFSYASDYRKAPVNLPPPDYTMEDKDTPFPWMQTQLRAARIPKMTAHAFLSSLYVPIFESGTEAERLVADKTPDEMADDLLYLQASVQTLIAPHSKPHADVLEAPLARAELVDEFTRCPMTERLGRVTRHVQALVGQIPTTVGLSSTRAMTPDCINLRVFGERSTPSMDKKRAEALSQVIGLLLTGKREPFSKVHNEKLRVKSDQLPEQLVPIFKDLIEPAATPGL